MHNQVARLLKQETAGVHARVEACLRLAEPGTSLDRIADVLERFVGFWTAAERVVDEWAAEHVDAAAALGWPRRRRLPHLHADLLVLGRNGAAGVAPYVALEATHADVLGWLYVSEGSTLGGAVIDRTMRAARADHPRLRTFTPYDEGPGPMWRAYLASLADWVADDAERSDAVVAAATRSFGALEDWLRGPLDLPRPEAAA